MSGHFIPPVVGVKVYRNDAVVLRAKGYTRNGGAMRREVTTFSKASRMRLAFVACNTSVVFRTMITLTYPRVYPSDGELVKKHLNIFLKRLGRKGFFLGWEAIKLAYLWFLEFQLRGAPHIHLLVSRATPAGLDERRELYKAVAEAWYAIVDSGDARHLAAGTRVERIRKVDGAARYAVKYAFKMKQKLVPAAYRNIGRFWGHSWDVAPHPVQTVRCLEDDVRGALLDWPYAPDPARPLFKVLYGCAERFKLSTEDGDIIEHVDGTAELHHTERTTPE